MKLTNGLWKFRKNSRKIGDSCSIISTLSRKFLSVQNKNNRFQLFLEKSNTREIRDYITKYVNAALTLEENSKHPPKHRNLQMTPEACSGGAAVGYCGRVISDVNFQARSRSC